MTGNVHLDSLHRRNPFIFHGHAKDFYLLKIALQLLYQNCIHFVMHVYLDVYFATNANIYHLLLFFLLFFLYFSIYKFNYIERYYRH
jgi:hypothetical protein